MPEVDIEVGEEAAATGVVEVIGRESDSGAHGRARRDGGATQSDRRPNISQGYPLQRGCRPGQGALSVTRCNSRGSARDLHCKSSLWWLSRETSK